MHKFKKKISNDFFFQNLVVAVSKKRVGIEQIVQRRDQLSYQMDVNLNRIEDATTELRKLRFQCFDLRGGYND